MIITSGDEVLQGREVGGGQLSLAGAACPSAGPETKSATSAEPRVESEGSGISCPKERRGLHLNLKPLNPHQNKPCIRRTTGVCSCSWGRAPQVPLDLLDGP